MMNKSIYTAIAVLSLTIGVAEEVSFSQLPNAAQKTINRNLYGGVVQEIERETEGGRTFYDVEVRREGKNRHLRVDAEGKLLAASKVGNISADADVDDGGVFDKNDGKILGVIDHPNDDDDFEAEAEVDDEGVSVEAKVDGPGDQGVTEDVFDKNDGKILDVLPAPSRNDGARVETDVDVDLDDDDRTEVAVDANQDHVTTDADGGLDTDKGDGRILGVPKRGFETLDMSKVSPVVQETIRREAGGYKIAEVEKASVNGREVFEVDIERDGFNRELHIAQDGTIVKDSDREAVGAPARTERGTDRN